MNFAQGTDIRDAGIEIVRPNGQPYAGTFNVDFLDNEVDRRTGTRTIYLLCEQKVEELTVPSRRGDLVPVDALTTVVGILLIPGLYVVTQSMAEASFRLFRKKPVVVPEIRTPATS